VVTRRPDRYAQSLMSVNVEIKARVDDPRRTSHIIEQLAGPPVARLCQHDTFFRVPRGRLKLRDFGDGSGELIYYERPDVEGPKESNYWIAPVNEVAALRTTLTLALGVRGEVRKVRRLHMFGQTRIHMDDVENLGTYLELEVVLDHGQSKSEGEKTACDLLRRLGIPNERLMAEAYVDLLDGRRSELE
jgi:predicted adenylyl cyclase CyaB